MENFYSASSDMTDSWTLFEDTQEVGGPNQGILSVVAGTLDLLDPA
jgi:hypothetical protein